MCEKYEGFNNWFTWSVNQWWMNDSGTEESIKQMAAAAVDNAKGNEFIKADRKAIHDLADTLKDMIQDDNPLTEPSGIYADLLQGAIDWIDFYELAEHWIDSMKEQREWEVDSQEQQVRKWMQSEIAGLHDENLLSEDMADLLAELAADEYDLYWGDEIPDQVRVWAAAVVEEYRADRYFAKQ